MTGGLHRKHGDERQYFSPLKHTSQDVRMPGVEGWLCLGVHDESVYPLPWQRFTRFELKEAQSDMPCDVYV